MFPTRKTAPPKKIFHQTNKLTSIFFSAVAAGHCYGHGASASLLRLLCYQMAKLVAQIQDTVSSLDRRSVRVTCGCVSVSFRQSTRFRQQPFRADVGLLLLWDQHGLEEVIGGKVLFDSFLLLLFEPDRRHIIIRFRIFPFRLFGPSTILSRLLFIIVGYYFFPHFIPVAFVY